MIKARHGRKKGRDGARRKPSDSRRAGLQSVAVRSKKAVKKAKSAAFSTNAGRGATVASDGRFLVFLVLALCAVLAIRLGVFEQNYQFQKSLAMVSGNCLDGTATPAFAIAESDGIILPAGTGSCSSTAVFEGVGKATGASVSGGMEVLSLAINGQEICGPCAGDTTYKFAKAQEGALHIAVKMAPKNTSNATQGKSRVNVAFVDNLYGTTITPEVGIKITGGWKSSPNTQIPSSIYGTDAPFHLNRARILPEYLLRFEWPYAGYTFLSALPPAVLNIALGTPPEYAYKLWQIALFFFPVAIFYLFSRKLGRGNDAVFAAASLLYLCFPVTGLLTGGGPDLFLYGMTAHSLATYLSLLFFFYAYEYTAEKRRGALVYATLFFMLAFLSNQRIIVALGALAFAACIPALARMDFRRIALLATCLFCSILWNALPFASSIDTGTYGALGGANISGEGTWIVAVLQSGYLVLPLLFLVGAWEAHKNRELRPLLLAGGAVLVLLFTTSPQVNRLAPFVDGIRFMPSFFLPAFLLAGMGAYFLWRLFIGAYERVSSVRKWDKTTYGGALVMAVFLPAAAVFFAVSATSTDFYVQTVGSLDAARDYVSQQQAAMIIGDERSLFISESRGSQYPVYEKNLQNTYVVDFGSSDSLATRMRDYRLRYVVLGSTKHALEKNRASTVPRYEEYLALKADSRFEEMPLAGGDRLFLLKGGERGDVLFAQGADIASNSVRFDRAVVAGTCNSDACSVVFFASAPSTNECVLSGSRCTAKVDAEKRMVSVQGIPRGEFGLSVSPKNQDYVLPLVLASALVIGACCVLPKDD